MKTFTLITFLTVATFTALASAVFIYGGCDRLKEEKAVYLAQEETMQMIKELDDLGLTQEIDSL